MIIRNTLITDLEIKTVKDLYKLKPFLEETSLKINKSQIARELEIDRRTVTKYINGFQKAKTRRTTNCLSSYQSLIQNLLDKTNPQVFYYKTVLYRYLIDNHEYKGSYRNFCQILQKTPELESYFHQKRPSNVNSISVRYETPAGKQAQLDWKESIEFLLKTGETVNVNVFVLLLSYSRYRSYYLSLTKTQDILLNFLDASFESFGGVPDEILCDNMKTVMDKPRTAISSGLVNRKFAQFAKDYGFKVKPCIAGRPQTKAKVESQMKLIDEIRAYTGQLDYEGLNKLLLRLNNRINTHVIQGTGIIPVLFLKKERTFLHPLPTETIRKPYKVLPKIVKVNHSSMINSGNCQYSVPPEFTGKYLTIQIYDNYLHIYDNTNIVAIHQVSSKKLNYLQEHYESIARKSHTFKVSNISTVAKENLKIIGMFYDKQ